MSTLEEAIAAYTAMVVADLALADVGTVVVDGDGYEWVRADRGWHNPDLREWAADGWWLSRAGVRVRYVPVPADPEARVKWIEEKARQRCGTRLDRRNPAAGVAA